MRMCNKQQKRCKEERKCVHMRWDSNLKMLFIEIH